jgi:exopolysaccharide biosynthesis protein
LAYPKKLLINFLSLVPFAITLRKYHQGRVKRNSKETAMLEKKTKQSIATKLSKARKARGSSAREKKLHTASQRSALDRHAAAMKALKTKGINGLRNATEKAVEARDEEDQAA